MRNSDGNASVTWPSSEKDLAGVKFARLSTAPTGKEIIVGCGSPDHADLAKPSHAVPQQKALLAALPVIMVGAHACHNAHQDHARDAQGGHGKRKWDVEDEHEEQRTPRLMTSSIAMPTSCPEPTVAT